MNKKIEFTINKTLLAKSGLTVVQYLTLAYLREDTDIRINNNETHILKVLEQQEFIRIIDENIIITPKVETIFETIYSVDARALLAHYNKLKKEYLKVNMRTRAEKYVVAFKGLLAKDFAFEHIKNVMTYLFITWKDDSFMRRYLASIDTIVRNFDKYSTEYEMSDAKESINTML